MSELVLRVLDIGFFVFHSAVILINVTGWIWARTRRVHLAVLGVTAFSWFALGPLLGFPLGYCFCTDWHWQVRRQLGYNDSGGYIQLLFQMAGLSIGAQTAAIIAYGVFGSALLGAIVVNVRTRRKC